VSNKRPLTADEKNLVRSLANEAAHHRNESKHNSPPTPLTGYSRANFHNGLAMGYRLAARQVATAFAFNCIQKGGHQ